MAGGHKQLEERAKKAKRAIAENPDRPRQYEKILKQERQIKADDMKRNGYTDDEIREETRTYDPILHPDLGSEIGFLNRVIKRVSKEMEIVEKIKADYQEIIIGKALGKDGLSPD